MTLKINENKITKMASFERGLHYLCIDWVARNLYFTYTGFEYNSYIVKFDLTMWENGIIKYDEISTSKIHDGLNVSPFMGYVYYRSPAKIIFH